VHDRLRARVLRTLAERDAELGAIFERMAARVRRELRAIGYSDRQVAEVLQRAFEETRAERVAAMETAIRDGAERGTEAHRETVRAIFGPESPEALEGAVPEGESLVPFRFATDADAMRIAGARIRGQVTRDGLSLSRRFHASDARIVDGLRRQIVASVRAGEGVIRTAERILDADRPHVEIPRHVREIARAAHAGRSIDGSPSELDRTVQRWAARVQRLQQLDPVTGERVGAYTMRSATQEMIRRVRSGQPADVERAVRRWIVDRAQHQARLVARTETVQAYTDAYVDASRSAPWTAGYRWSLSGRHPKADECDLYAAQNLHGLGAGGYPADAIPPRHPGDLCVITQIVDPHYRARARARESGAPEPPAPWRDPRLRDAAAVLRGMDPAKRLEILGPTRARVFDQPGGAARVLERGGAPAPVWRVLGQAGPPPRTYGPRVDVTALLRDDRSTMVQALPPAPRLAAGDDGRRR